MASVGQQSKPPAEVVFVIDGGPPEDVTRLQSLLTQRPGGDSGPLLRVLRQEWAGPAAARNHGLSASRAGIVVFLEADGEYSSNYFERVARCLADPAVGAVSPELRLAVTSRAGWTARFQRARWRGIAVLTRAGRRPVLGGWAFRRDVFDRVRGYDERLTVGEDRDLVERVRALDMRIVVARRTFFSHPEPSSPSAVCAKAFVRAMRAAPFYRVQRPMAFVTLRAAGAIALLTTTILSAVSGWFHAAWPLLVIGGAAVVGASALFTRTWCDVLVVTAARQERVGPAFLARVAFTTLRALEQVAALCGAMLGVWTATGHAPAARTEGSSA